MVSQVANCLRVFDLAFDHERFVDRHEDCLNKFVELVEDECLVFREQKQEIQCTSVGNSAVNTIRR